MTVLNYKQCVVLVLDDDPRVREALASLLRSADLQVFTFASAEELLQAKTPDLPTCLILDLQLPGVSGLDLQQTLAGLGGPPIVFISGHGDIPSSVRAMQGGAVEFLPKPFGDGDLFEAIDAAIARDVEAREQRAGVAEMQRLYARLTSREREVFPLIVAGLTNKQSAARLGIAEITLQVHRARIMQKMKAQSVPELVRIATRLKRG